MPAPGEQHTISSTHSVTNPFEEVSLRLSEYTAQEIATLQSRLEKQLGPEYISSRSGPSGQKVHYIAAEKCIQLANEIFGFNGWSSTIRDVQVDFCDENPTTLKVSLGLSVIVRVTLKDGTFHEDIGYGHIENCKGKAPAFEKAKKEGTTDALKRALRNFGNVLGNCIYDKEYLAKVTKVKVAPRRWDVDNLHRHTTVKRDNIGSHHEPLKAGMRQTEQAEEPSISTGDNFDDEFGDFDEADFSVTADPEAHPDEVALAKTSVSTRQINAVRPGQARSEAFSKREAEPPRRPPLESQLEGVAPIETVPSSIRPPPKSLAMQESKPGLDPTPVSKGVTGLGSESVTRSLHSGRVLNQPSRIDSSVVPTVPGSVHQPPIIQDKSAEVDSLFLPPTGPIGAGFYSARIADKLPAIVDNETTNVCLPENLPSFNLHGESPSIRRTPGVDHKRTKPMNKEFRSIPGDSQHNSATPNHIHKPAFAIGPRDVVRKVGAPVSPSPMTRGNSYKPPTMKRPNDQSGLNRMPLEDIRGNNAPEMAVTEELDAKRQKMNQV